MIRYALAWLGTGTVVAVALIVALSGGTEPDEVSLPPVRETELASAARGAGCQFRRASHGERRDPPVEGVARATPARPGVYERSPDAEMLTAAVRRGIIVIQYRRGLADGDLDDLRTVQRALPVGTIVAPNDTAMPYELVVTAYRRLLGCVRFTDRAVAATRLFQGRYLGRGPESTR